MDFLSDEFLMNTDLTNIELGLPDELHERARDVMERMMSTIIDVARHFYGDEFTPDQFKEAAILTVLSIRKEVAPEGMGV